MLNHLSGLQYRITTPSTDGSSVSHLTTQKGMYKRDRILSHLKAGFVFFSIGNELCGSGVGARVAANQYAIDTINLRNIVNRVYQNVSPMPLVIGPGGFFDDAWFREYLNKTEDSLNATTRHIYNLGPGNLNTQLFSFHILQVHHFPFNHLNGKKTIF